MITNEGIIDASERVMLHSNDWVVKATWDKTSIIVVRARRLGRNHGSADAGE